MSSVRAPERAKIVAFESVYSMAGATAPRHCAHCGDRDCRPPRSTAPINDLERSMRSVSTASARWRNWRAAGRANRVTLIEGNAREGVRRHEAAT